MQKLRNSILDRMIEAKLTSNEVDFLIYISRFQNDDGRVEGVHYKELCEAMHMSYQGFYDVKNSLIEKGFIISEKNNRIDHDITIVDNVFKSEDDIRSGYVNTNQHIFFDEKYFKLKAGAKLLAMELLRMSYFGTGGTKGQFRIGTEKFYDKYTRMFGVTKRVMRSYLTSLKTFFSIGIVEGLYYIRPKTSVYKQRGQASENHNYAAHNVDVICRRNRIKSPNKEDVNELISFDRQYRKKAENAKKDFFEALKRAVEKSLKVLNIKYTSIKIRVLKPKLIHSILKEELAY